jgi:hypothetical protein
MKTAPAWLAWQDPYLQPRDPRELEPDPDPSREVAR